MTDTPEIARKREQEKRTMEIMIRMFCHGNGHKRGDKSRSLCPECEKLLDYANMRTNRCPFMAEKTFCSACKVHCYSKEMQEQVRKVMRYAGPRMLFVHPVMVLRHVKVSLENKKKSRN